MNKKVVIFDMDGLIIDSEPLWQQAEIQVFGRLGVTLTVENCREVMGLRIDEVVEYWFRKHAWSSDKSHAEIIEEILTALTNLILEKGNALPGVLSLMGNLKAAGVRMALASSSPLNVIHAVLEKLGIRDYFEVVRSGEQEEYGKPHPAIYIHTAKEMKVQIEECLVLEDSLNGIIAAKAARMKVIGVPDASEKKKPGYGVADILIDSLEQWQPEFLSV